MRTAVRRTAWSIDDFIAWENGQATKHEFVHGEIFAMVGGAILHAMVIGNIYAALRSRLTRPCLALTNDAKVRVESSGSVYYPDVVVTCTPQDPRRTVLADPVLVVEVLSEGTAKFDRTTKRADYASIPSVQYILLVDTDERRVELDRREADGGWTRETVTEEGAVELPGLGAALDLDDIYAQ